MSKIKVMGENLANKIAAGEVVEKISSVVKELVENAIDAKSKNIKVELLDAGKRSIRVVDDGIGMDEDDAKSCFLRHATSKIYKDDDLFFISTLGFRGEALPSIAAVSEVILETYDGRTGTKIHIKGGEISELGIAPSRNGTIFTVTNLFYNTPARLKYLKSEPTELAYVTQFIEKLSLSYPEISFTLINNNSTVVRTTGSGNLLKTIYEIYGNEVSSNMIEIRNTTDDYDIHGYISKPIIQRPRTLFVREDEEDNVESTKLKPIIEDSDEYDKKSIQETIDLKMPKKNEEIKALELYPVGIALGTYIIAENDEGIYLIDQHAAVERINYEKVLKGLIEKSTVTMIIPINIELSSSDMTILKSRMDILESFGFDIEEFGINTFKINGHPSWIRESFEYETIRTIFDLIVEEKTFDPLKFNDKVAATIACKKSLKGNTRITLDLAGSILKDLVLCDNPYNCPHGRPTIIKFTKYELEKMFKRAM